MNADLVVFGEDWGAHPSSTQHLIKRLQHQRKVVWVNSIGMRRPRCSPKDIKRAAQKLSAMVRQPPHAAGQGDRLPGFSVVAPRGISWPGNPVARYINCRLLSRQLKQTMAASGVEKPILWLSLPTAVDIVGKLGERATVYYCGDDFSALDGVDHQAVTAMEQELAHKADLVLVASSALAKKFPAAKTVVLPHGADVAQFTELQPRPADLPCGRPIAGFYGSLSSWVDVQLLADVAQRLPCWNMVLIGPQNTDLSPLTGLPNVHLLGEKPHHALPGYVQHWQVSMLPFRDNAQIRACNPLKLREYLSAGRPVVSSDFPALDGYRDLLHVAQGARGFTEAILLSSGDFPGNPSHTLHTLQTWQHVEQLGINPRRRQARVMTESWDARSKQLNEILDSL